MDWVRAITFDFWGTLVDVDSSGIQGCAAVLKQIGLNTEDANRLYFDWDAATVREYRSGPWEPYVNFGARGLKRVLGARVPDQESVDWLELSELLVSTMTRNAQPHPEAPRLIEFLKPRYPLCPITNMDLRLFDLNPFKSSFDMWVTAEEAGAYKPSESIFLEAVNKLGVAPQHILHVSLAQFADVEGAKPLGMKVAWINRSCEAQGLYTPDPDYQFPDLNGVYELFAS